jgi:putative membrane protein
LTGLGAARRIWTLLDAGGRHEARSNRWSTARPVGRDEVKSAAPPGRPAARLPTRLRSELRWKLLLARLVVSVAAVVVTVVVVPGISIDGRFWVWALVLGAVFGVLNGVVKPILQILTIRYLFLSWGLVLLAINTATLWLLELLVSPLDIENGFSLLAGGFVIGLVVPLLETVVGIGRPIIEPSGESTLTRAR